MSADRDDRKEADRQAEIRAKRIANLRPWQKGQSGNPAGGRPISLMRQIREATDGGREIVRVLTEILMDQEAKRQDRVKAGEVLLDRGWGKAIATHLVADAGSIDGLPDGLSEASDVLLESIARSLAKRPTAPALPVGNPVTLDVKPTQPAEISSLSADRATNTVLVAQAPTPPAPSPEPVKGRGKGARGKGGPG